MSHKCHAAGCSRAIHPSFMMCSFHWFKVPSRLKALVWKHYRPGQEEDKQPSHEYCQTAEECVRVVGEKCGATPEQIERACEVYRMLDPGPTETLF